MNSYRLSEGEEEFVVELGLGLEREQLRHALTRTRPTKGKPRDAIALERAILDMFGITSAVGSTVRGKRMVFYVRKVPRIDRMTESGMRERVFDEPCMHGLIQYEIGGVQFHDVLVRDAERFLDPPILSPCISNLPED